MEQEKNNLKEFNWEINEKNKHKRDKKWYIIASIITISLIVYALITKNFFFALIIIISSALIIFFDNEEDRILAIKIKYDGVGIGNNFFEFEGMRNFYIIYRPKEEIKKIYFEFKNPLKNRLSIQLNEQNPVEIREFILKYLEEDLEKEHEPLSEGLAKIFRL